jgi:hypothetical protein
MDAVLMNCDCMASLGAATQLYVMQAKVLGHCWFASCACPDWGNWQLERNSFTMGLNLLAD